MNFNRHLTSVIWSRIQATFRLATSHRLTVKFHLPQISIVFFLSLAISISLPTFHPLDVVRVKFGGPGDVGGVQEIVFGIWSFCVKLHNFSQSEVCDVLSPCNLGPGTPPLCTPRRYGYEARFLQTTYGNTTLPEVTIDSLFLRLLVIHVVVSVLLLASLACLIARRPAVLLIYATSLVQFTAFVIDLVVYRHVAMLLRASEREGFRKTVLTGAGLWLGFVVLLLLLVECALVAKECAHAQAGELPTTAAAPDVHVEMHVRQRCALSTSDVLHTNGERGGSARQCEAQVIQECLLCLEQSRRVEDTSGKDESITGVWKWASLPCGHAFCYDCITKALEISSCCPLCRRRSSKRDLKAMVLRT